jgi:hypothetical protein
MVSCYGTAPDTFTATNDQTTFINTILNESYSTSPNIVATLGNFTGTGYDVDAIPYDPVAETFGTTFGATTPTGFYGSGVQLISPMNAINNTAYIMNSASFYKLVPDTGPTIPAITNVMVL